MKYIHSVTGVFIETDSKLGGAWREYNPSETPVQKTPTETPQVEEVIETEDLTKKQIMQELDALGIEYDQKMRKAELSALMKKKRW